MNLAANLLRLQRVVNHPGVYIEDGIFCMARVEGVSATTSGMEATLVSIPDWPLVCYFRERPRLFVEEPCPFGSQWAISKEWAFFFLEDGYWDGSLHMGFRLLFADDVVRRFLDKDLSSVEEYLG
jgi:hypothetical protein